MATLPSAGAGQAVPQHRLAEQLRGVARCPYCSTPHPTLVRLWQSQQMLERATPGPRQLWAAYRCTTCGSALLAKGVDNEESHNALVAEVVPRSRVAHADLPEPARTYLQQALETLHAPDAAAVMAGSAVDAMLKRLGYTEGNVYSRIDKAVADHRLTDAMGQWAHEVRLGSNRPRHSDETRPHVTRDEAERSVEFADALGQFLFVLTARIERETAAAKKASDAGVQK
jgi:DNA-directed RNA polymerase subunit RPC12/RpoP